MALYEPVYFTCRVTKISFAFGVLCRRLIVHPSFKVPVHWTADINGCLPIVRRDTLSSFEIVLQISNLHGTEAWYRGAHRKHLYLSRPCLGYLSAFFCVRIAAFIAYNCIWRLSPLFLIYCVSRPSHTILYGAMSPMILINSVKRSSLGIFTSACVSL